MTTIPLSFNLLTVDLFASYCSKTKEELLSFLYSADDKYYSFQIPKRKGGLRNIHIPCKELKDIQCCIVKLLETMYNPKKCVHGFVKGRSIITNASQHVGKRYVAKIDLKDFFETITFPRIRGLLISSPYNITHEVATVIAHAACYNKHLAQGSPCSPLLSNMVASSLDSQLIKLARDFRVSYSRYADDITFSSQQPFNKKLLNHVGGVWSGKLIRAIYDSGFTPHPDKTKLLLRSNRQEVAGIIVNERINIRRSFIDKVRCALHSWEKFGYTDANDAFCKKFPSKRHNLDVYLAGQLAHIGNVRGKCDPIFCKLMRRYAALTSNAYFCQINDQERLASALFILLDSDGEECGTAFLAKGRGLISCEHAAREAMYCVHWAKRDVKYFVEIVKSSSTRDLAILKIVNFNQRYFHHLEIDKDYIAKSTDKCTYAGFPNPNGQDKPSYYKGTIVCIKTREHTDHIKISEHIIGGASGSPLVNDRNHVIGVVVRGVGNGEVTNTSIDESLAVCIKYIDEL